MFTVCRIQNTTDEVRQLYAFEFQPDQIYIIPDSEREGWANDDNVMLAITSEEFIILDDVAPIIGISNQLNYLKGLNRMNVVIADSTKKLDVIQKGFPDYSGHPYFADSVWGTAPAKDPETPETPRISYFYLSFNQDVRIQGATVENSIANLGDFYALHLTYGVGGPVVGEFVAKRGLLPGVSSKWERILPDSQVVPQGICFRLTYSNNGDLPVHVVCAFDLRRIPA